LSSTLQWIDDALLLKIESREISAYGLELSSYFAALSEQLTQMISNYPSLSLDNEYLPEVFVSARTSLEDKTALRFAPIAGLTGRTFERALLLALDAPLNLMEALADALRADEKNAQQSRFVGTLSEQLSTLEDSRLRIMGHYFVDPVSN